MRRSPLGGFFRRVENGACRVLVRVVAARSQAFAIRVTKRRKAFIVVYMSGILPCNQLECVLSAMPTASARAVGQHHVHACLHDADRPAPALHAHSPGRTSAR